MGRYLEQQYGKDYMRMAMLKQEETFKHQVTELHRLYRVQKLLMNDMMAEKRRQRNSSSSSRTKLERWNWSTDDNEYSCQDQRRNHGGLDLGLPSEELYIMGNKHGRDVMLDVDEEEEEEEEEECGLELTLATGSRSGRKKENSFASDSGASFSSSSTDQSGTGAKFNGSEWGVVFHDVPDMNYHRERKSVVVFDVEERKRGEMVKQPPWLFHCSSLNMT